MDFVGTGKRLAQGDIGEAARWLGLPTAALLAIIEVEAAGRGFDSKNRPKMLFEPHVFWRELGDTIVRKAAATAGLAYKSWGAKPYPKDSYPRLKDAHALAAKPALRSASWGLGQLLGDKFVLCGHASEESFVRANMQGEREQLLCMTALLIAWGVPKMLVGKDLTNPATWRPFAAKWNGSGYAKHNYHGRLADAFIKHDKGEPMATPAPATAVLQRGMRGEAVRNLQNDLAALGYVFELGIDGRFGGETDAIVRNFQARAGLTIDGKVGPETQAAIDLALAEAAEIVQPAAPEWAGQDKPADPIFPVPIPATAKNTPPIWLFALVGLIVLGGIGYAILSGGFNVG